MSPTCTITKGILAGALGMLLCSLPNASQGAEAGPSKEALVFLRSRTAYVATVSDANATVRQLSPPEQKVLRLGVCPSAQVAWMLTEGNAESHAVVAEEGFEVKLLERTPELPFDGGIALSPDGKSLAYVAHEEIGLALYCRNLDTGEVQTLTGNWDALKAPAWSPDGKMIAYYCGKRTDNAPDIRLSLRVIDVATGREKELAGPSEITRYGGESRYPPIWSPTSDRVFFEARYEGDGAAGSVYAADVAGEKKPVPLTTGLCSSISSEGDALYVADDGAYAVPVSGPERQRTLIAPWPAWFPKISPSAKMIAYVKHSALYCRFLDNNAEVLVADGYNEDWTGFFWVISSAERGKTE